MRKRGAKFRRLDMPMPPSFAITQVARNNLGVRERAALDAILSHHANKDDLDSLVGMIEAGIYAARIAAKHPACTHLDPEGLKAAEAQFMAAGWAIHHAKRRYDESGVFGLDAADRQALIDAEALSADMRTPGVILRTVWVQAFRMAIERRGGIPLTPVEAE